MSVDDVVISVIVPGYNVEKYIGACLDSLTEQTIAEKLEVLMIDDGSSDSTGAIMDEYALKHANFFAYHYENGGLGKARNLGISCAKGAYIAFVDSDDLLSLDWYEKLLKVAETSQAEIVIGNVKRFNDKKNYPSSLHQRVFLGSDKIGTNIKKSPELIHDTTAWNKLIRLDFWKKNAFFFPEGMLYEDIPVTIPMHILAEKVSIVHDPFYFWRSREGSDASITQQRSNPRNLVDRMNAIQMVYEFMHEHQVSEDTKRNFDSKNMTNDFKIYIYQIPTASKEYRKKLVPLLQPMVAGIDRTLFSSLRRVDKFRYFLIKNGFVTTLTALEYMTKIMRKVKKRLRK